MKFFTLVILPKHGCRDSEEALLQAVKDMMWPHRDRTVVGDNDFKNDAELAPKWDGYSPCPIEMLKHYGYSIPEAASDDDLVVRPVDGILVEDFFPGGSLGEADVLTSDGEWIHGPKTRDINQDDWTLRLKATLADHQGLDGILLFCHH